MEAAAQAIMRTPAAPAQWVSIPEDLARTHRLFGVRGALIAVLLVYCWCAAVSMFRLCLLIAGVSGWRGALPADEMVLTFMPVADLAFGVLFIALLVQSLSPLRRTAPENGTILCGLYVLYVIPYVLAFRHLTQTAAFSFRSPATYLHYVLPVLFCLAAAAYLVLSRRVQVTYRALVRRGDPILARSGAPVGP